MRQLRITAGCDRERLRCTLVELPRSLHRSADDHQRAPVPHASCERAAAVCCSMPSASMTDQFHDARRRTDCSMMCTFSEHEVVLLLAASATATTNIT
eukprot:19159-Heterococcus_DN1.PRE.3